MHAFIYNRNLDFKRKKLYVLFSIPGAMNKSKKTILHYCPVKQIGEPSLKSCESKFFKMKAPKAVTVATFDHANAKK
jgi:hypothetical protein